MSFFILVGIFLCECVRNSVNQTIFCGERIAVKVACRYNLETCHCSMFEMNTTGVQKKTT